MLLLVDAVLLSWLQALLRRGAPVNSMLKQHGENVKQRHKSYFVQVTNAVLCGQNVYFTVYVYFLMCTALLCNMFFYCSQARYISMYGHAHILNLILIPKIQKVPLVGGKIAFKQTL